MHASNLSQKRQRAKLKVAESGIPGDGPDDVRCSSGPPAGSGIAITFDTSFLIDRTFLPSYGL
jgi:hypothetical protein